MQIRAISDVISDLGEGPIWSPQKNSVIWTDITQKTFHVADFISGTTQSFPAPSMIGALALTKSEDLIAATQEGFSRVSESGIFTTLHKFLKSDMRMNDGKVDPVGRFWAGSLELSFEENRGSLYVLEKNGTYRTVIENLTLSNGMGWSPGGEYFYYIDSLPGVLRRFDYESNNGKILNPIDLVVFDTSQGIPDGMCVTSDGLILVALWDGGRIEVYDPNGKKISNIQVGVSRPTSCTFGGENNETLIVTTASQGIDRITEPFAGKVLAINGLGFSGLPVQRYG